MPIDSVINARKYTPDFPKAVSLQLVSSDIALQVSGEISVDVDNVFSVTEDCTEQGFTLYRNMQVDSVLLDG